MTRPKVTLEEAQQALPHIRHILKRLVQINKTIEVLSTVEITSQDEFEELKADLRTSKELHRLSLEFFDSLGQLLDRGCIVKDLDLGLVDFYSEFQGRAIFLCWKMSESKVAHWHELDAGYEERKPILELVEKSKA